MSFSQQNESQMEIRAYSRQLSLKEGEELLKLIVSVDIRRNGMHLS